MKCPVCNTVDLVMSDRQGIEIDYCPQCRGVWLDRGELDKIIERSAAISAPPMQHTQQPVHNSPPPYGYQQQDRHYGHHKKRESFWSDLFD